MQLHRELLAILEYFERERGLDRQEILEAIEEGLVSVYRKKEAIGEDESLHIDPQTSEVCVVSAGGEKRRAPELPMGRIMAQNARQMIMQKIRKAEKVKLLEEYSDKIGTVVSALVDHYAKNGLVVSLGRIDGIIPPAELTPFERHKRKGMSVRAVITAVGDGENQPPRIELSARHPALVSDVLAREITEIRDGLVEIKAIARQAGEISKVAVISGDARIDPVGTCVGVRGTRIRSVMKELGGERIDIVRWKEKPAEMIASTLAPARVVRVDVDEKTGRARVVVPDDQLAVAVGQRGMNVNMSSQLSGYQVDLVGETEDRTGSLPAFTGALPEMPEETIRSLEAAGYASFKDILTAEPGALAAVAGIDTREKALEVVDRIRRHLDSAGN